jgi:hypothetical protein
MLFLGLKFSGEGLVQQRLLRRLQRGVLLGLELEAEFVDVVDDLAQVVAAWSHGRRSVGPEV